MSVRRFAPLLLAAAALAFSDPRPAQANGAFPDSVGILLPPDHPDQIVLATNFGLISTDDNGKTWLWSCEQNIAAFASLYQLGPAPLNRIYTMSGNGLLRSDDVSCTWQVAGGSAKTALLTDFFPDPTDPMKVLAIALPNSPDIVSEVILRSDDSGATFGPPLYTGPIKGGLTGVENARTDPKIIYLASYVTPGLHPQIIKSTDGGQSWSDPVDIEAGIGPNSFGIIAVDPADSQKVYLLVSEALAQSLAISTDGGATFQTPVKFTVKLNAFARLASGTILVAGNDADDAGQTLPVGYRSTDGGKTFLPWKAPRLRALAERDGKLYGAADNAADGFALGVSTDEGETFVPLLKYDKVTAVQPCVASVCAESCRTQAKLGLWSADLCPPAPADGGVDGGPPPMTKSGGCRVGGQRGASMLVVLLAALGVSLARRRRGARVPAARSHRR